MVTKFWASFMTEPFRLIGRLLADGMRLGGVRVLGEPFWPMVGVQCWPDERRRDET